MRDIVAKGMAGRFVSGRHSWCGSAKLEDGRRSESGREDGSKGWETQTESLKNYPK